MLSGSKLVKWGTLAVAAIEIISIKLCDADDDGVQRIEMKLRDGTTWSGPGDQKLMDDLVAQWDAALCG